jgi:hypothetical protein
LEATVSQLRAHPGYNLLSARRRNQKWFSETLQRVSL